MGKLPLDAFDQRLGRCRGRPQIFEIAQRSDEAKKPDAVKIGSDYRRRPGHAGAAVDENRALRHAFLKGGENGIEPGDRDRTRIAHGKVEVTDAWRLSSDRLPAQADHGSDLVRIG